MTDLRPPTLRWYHMAGSLALLGVALGATQYGRRVLAQPTRGALCAPYRFDAQQVRALIGEQISGGQRDPYVVASNTAVALFGSHPDGGWVTFPPPADARDEVKCVWERINELVDEVFVARGVQPALLSEETWKVVDSTGADLANYPWNEPAFDVHRRPAPGTFYLAQPGDNDTVFLRAVLAAALQMAGIPSEVAFDASSRTARRLRKELRDVILCSAFNDGRITSTSPELAGGRSPGANGPTDTGVTNVLGPRGRGLVWAARHNDDVARIAQSLAPKRNIELDGTAIGAGRSQMLLYIPAINLAALRGETPVITVEGMGWGDGRSTLEPPSAVAALGLDFSGVNLPGGVGCAPSSSLVG